MWGKPFFFFFPITFPNLLFYDENYISIIFTPIFLQKKKYGSGNPIERQGNTINQTQGSLAWPFHSACFAKEVYKQILVICSYYTFISSKSTSQLKPLRWGTICRSGMTSNRGVRNCCQIRSCLVQNKRQFRFSN